MKVSIILPIYNVENYLEECLESVQRQTLKDIEIVCVNDGSTDNSLEIVKRFAKNDSRFVVIDVKNGGYGKAMNLGIDHATGEYMGIVEPDDYVPLNMFEDLYNVAKENELDFVKADFYRFSTNQNGDRNFTYARLAEVENYNKILNPSETPQLMLPFPIVQTWSGIYKLDFINKYNIRHNETPGASYQDNGFFFQTFVYAKKAMFINKPCYRCRRDNPNSSVKSKGKVYCMNEEFAFIKKILKKDGNEEIWERFKTYYNLKKFHSYTFTLARISDEYKKEYLTKISEEFKTAYEQKEIDLDIFRSDEKSKITLMMENPDEYYRKYVVPKPSVVSNPTADKDRMIDSLKREIVQLKNSKTYKVGNFILFVPKKIKRLLGR